jgi:Tol biopolymer transport system component
LTFNSFNDIDPVWSPDGLKIAFSSDRTGASTIWIMNPDGSGQTQLTTDATANDFQPAWSPDGKKIAFTRLVGSGDTDIYVVDAVPGSIPTLVGGFKGAIDRYPRWSANGNLIMFSSNRVTGTNPTGDEEIFIMNADGTDVTQVTDNTVDDSYPEWSPDGHRIVFTRSAAPPSTDVHLWVMDARGESFGLTQLTTTPGVLDTGPGWSPDGLLIAFARHPASIFVIDARGESFGSKMIIDIDSDDDPDFQRLPPLPPVGGIVIPVNKLEILTPYLALVGLTAVISLGVMIEKRMRATHTPEVVSRHREQ